MTVPSILIFRCVGCGQQYLLPHVCCEMECQPAPLLHNSIADSVHSFAEISFSILLHTDNNVAEIRKTIDSLLKHPPEEPLEFVFVDNSSTDGTRAFIRDLALKCRVRLLSVRQSERRSYGSLFNLGASAARGRRLLFAECGINVRHARLFAELSLALSDPAVGLIGVSHLWKNSRAEPKPSSSNPHYSFSLTPLKPILFGVRAEVFWEVGAMDERFNARAGEVADLQYRLIRSNYRLAKLKVDGSQKSITTASKKRAGLQLETISRAEIEKFSRKYRRPLNDISCLKRFFFAHPYPKLSVAIATRNYGRWLRRCLDSILRARNLVHIPIQVVVTDDCSTDDSRLILEEYRKKHPTILNLVRPATSRGISAVKNAAIRRSIGEYVALLDADDEFHQNKLARCIDALRAAPETDLLTHDYLFIDEATNERFVPGDDWYGDWRPPGVWVFRTGRVLFNEQMVCGYEELEWTERFWRELRRTHIPETLAIVHGEQTDDRWKIDRSVAGIQGMKRWHAAERAKRTPKAFACRTCGQQYFNRGICCGRPAEEVPLVCYTAISSFPYHSPVEFSIVIFVDDDLAATRGLCAELLQQAETEKAELIFVACHARRALLKFLRQIPATTRLKAIFAPGRQPFVYGHDVNRAMRIADGRNVVLLKSQAQLRSANLLSSLRHALSDKGVGIVGASNGKKNVRSEAHASEASTHHFTERQLDCFCWAIRQDVFWELGGMDERFEGDNMAMLDLQYRAIKEHYRLAVTKDAIVTLRRSARSNSKTGDDLALFEQKHGRKSRRSVKRVGPFANHRRAEISIALRTRNEASYLPLCLNSILQSARQTRLPFQIVVVNDCSTDDTFLILESYRQRFPQNFTIIHSERSDGRARALNLVLARSVGKYVAFIEADATFSDEKLKLCWQRLEESEADFLFHDWTWAKGRAKNSQPYSRQQRQRSTHLSTWVFRNGAVRFNEQIWTKACEFEWLDRRMPQLQTLFLPLPLTLLRRSKR